MKSYGEFSDLYDGLMDDVNYRSWGIYLKEIFKTSHIEVRSILEMACGTGNLTKELLELGYNVDGFDLSVDMLSVAKEKLKRYRNLRLFKLDMTKFAMDKKYDAVLAACDSINYILEYSGIYSCFERVYNHLKPGGIFVFDINSEFKLKDILGNNIFLEDRDNVFYTWENQLDESTGIVDFILTFFTTDDGSNYRRFDEHHRERIYAVDFLVEALNKSGFSKIEYYKAFTFDSVNNKTERISFIAIK